jgi:hypothetical protein
MIFHFDRATRAEKSFGADILWATWYSVCLEECYLRKISRLISFTRDDNAGIMMTIPSISTVVTMNIIDNTPIV